MFVPPIPFWAPLGLPVDAVWYGVAALLGVAPLVGWLTAVNPPAFAKDAGFVEKDTVFADPEVGSESAGFCGATLGDSGTVALGFADAGAVVTAPVDIVEGVFADPNGESKNCFAFVEGAAATPTVLWGVDD